MMSVPLSMLLAGALTAVASPQATPLDGVWRSRGYGYVFEITGSTLQAFEVTATTCVPGFTARRAATIVPQREATFETPEGDVYFIRSDGDADLKLLHNDGSASDMRIDRQPRPPTVCDNPTPNTPADVFEVFARTWAEHYVSFDLKETDWAKVVAANRPKITARTTPAELFDIFEGMIGPFNDTHTFLKAPELKRQFRKRRPGTDRVIKGGFEEFRSKGLPALLAVTDRAYLRAPLRNWCNDQIQYGHLDDATGYLRILSFNSYSKEGGFAGGLTALESALDAIFSDPALKALIIDVRINWGGYDPYGLAIASRLATREYLAYTKEARADAVDRNKWTPGDPSWVRPSSRPGFRGPVVELIGPLTISAGETFSQALMGRTPRLTRIGENTQGVFSDVLGRRLPNGWSFGLPNEVFRTPEGTTFDGMGIPPDVAVPVYADEDVAAGKDSGMAKAVQVLGLSLSTPAASLLAGTGPVGEATPEIVGRWDLTVQGTKDAFPSWLEVQLSGDRTLVGRFVGWAGSARPISRVDFTEHTMHFAIPPQWEQGTEDLRVEARLEGGRLTGWLTDPAGAREPLTGERAPALRHAEPAWGSPVALFDGKDLSGWQATGPNQWQVVKGILTSPEPGSNLRTERTFTDFKLHLEFRIPAGGNSGVYLRGRHEVQVEDSKGMEPDSHHEGGVYGFLPPNEDAARAPGEWQTYDITLVGRLVTVVLNGRTVIAWQEIPGITGGALDSREGEPGPILLQGDHSAVEYRNIVLTPPR